MVHNRPLTIRQAELADVRTLVALRIALFRDLGDPACESVIALVSTAISTYLERKLLTSTYVAWLAELEGTVVATASMIILEKMPSLHNPTGLEGYLMNVYTLPAFRRQGAAETLVQAAIGFACARGIGRISLHASTQGGPLYEHLGFEHIGHEMRWEERE